MIAGSLLGLGVIVDLTWFGSHDVNHSTVVPL